MKKNNVSVSVLAFFIINALIGCASRPAFEGKGDLCGLVVDENNKPVKDFVVYCKPVNEKFYSQPIRPVLTNASGLFVFYGLSSCEYLLSGSKNAYLKIEPVSYSFDDRTKIICIQTKSFKAAVLNAEELLKLGQKEEALKLGSIKASYLLIELYFDDDSPYKDLEKTISYAKQLFDATKDPDLAFLLGNIYDQQLKDYMKALNWYENAHRLGHKRVAFYLGRFYYYGVLRTKRDGIKALKYFEEAAANGIMEADAYIKDIKELGGEDLQSCVEKWERAVQAGSGAAALKIALYKQSQVFYIANSYEIEKAFNEALGLGSYQAAYELGKIYQMQEADENYKGEIRSIKYFEKAYDNNYDGFDKDNLFKVIEYKAEKTDNNEEKIRLYLNSAKTGHVPAVEKLIELVPVCDDKIEFLYNELREIAETGDDACIIGMNKLDSVVEFAVAELPVKADDEENYLKIYKLILSEYLPDENAEVIIANSRMIGSAMRETKNNIHSYNILMISSKNQYMFKLSSRDRREMMQFKDRVLEIAKSLVETGEIYVATEESRRNIGLSFLLRSNESGFLSIGKSE